MGSEGSGRVKEVKNENQNKNSVFETGNGTI